MPAWVAHRLIAVLALPALAVAPVMADEALWSALKAGGKVVLMRHAAVERGSGRPLHLIPGCDGEMRLSMAGQRQAEEVGKAFRKRKIPVGNVLASPYCRTMETARVAFGSAKTSTVLHLLESLDARGSRAQDRRGDKAHRQLYRDRESGAGHTPTECRSHRPRKRRAGRHAGTSAEGRQRFRRPRPVNHSTRLTCAATFDLPMYFKIASVRVVSYSVGEGTFPEEKQLNQNAAPRYGSIALEGRLTKTCVNNLQSFLSPHNANKYGVKVEINLKFQTSLDETAHKSPYIGEIHIEGGDVVIDVLLDASMFLPVVAMKKTCSVSTLAYD